MEELTLEQPNDAVILDATYRYERSDGTIEYASNMEDVIARCPVIGRIALESPERANSLLALAAFGAEPMVTTTKKETTHDVQPTVDQPKQEAAPSKPTREQTAPEPVLTQPPTRETTLANLPQEITKTMLPAAVREEAATVENVVIESSIEVQTLAGKYPVGQIAETPLRLKPSDEMKSAHTQTPELTVIRPVDKTVDVVTRQADVEQIPQDGIPPEISKPVEIMDAAEIEELHSLLVEVYKEQELNFKAQHTYETDDAQTQDSTSYRAGLEPPALLEAFQANRGRDQPILTFEAIQERASEQPLIETLTLVAEYVSIVEPDSMPDIVRTLFDEIEKTLDGCGRHDLENENSFVITPEMTEKLVELLVLIGYERPKETLLDCVNTYSLMLLLELVEYICHLSKDGYNQEFKGNQTISFMAQGQMAQMRFSKLLYAFIAKITLQPNYTKL